MKSFEILSIVLCALLLRFANNVQAQVTDANGCPVVCTADYKRTCNYNANNQCYKNFDNYCRLSYDACTNNYSIDERDLSECDAPGAQMC